MYCFVMVAQYLRDFPRPGQFSDSRKEWLAVWQLCISAGTAGFGSIGVGRTDKESEPNTQEGQCETRRDYGSIQNGALS